MRRQTPKFNFTKNTLMKLVPPDKKSDTYKDTREKGLLLIVSYGGSKTFRLGKVIKGEYKKIKIGHFPGLPIKEARLKAAELKYQIAIGEYPTNKTSSPIKSAKKNFKINFKEPIAKPVEYTQLKLESAEIQSQRYNGLKNQDKKIISLVGNFVKN